MDIFNIDNDIVISEGINTSNNLQLKDYIDDPQFKIVIETLNYLGDREESTILFLKKEKNKYSFELKKIDDEIYNEILNLLYEEQVIDDVLEMLTKWHFTLAMTDNFQDRGVLSVINEKNLEYKSRKEEIDKKKADFLENINLNLDL